MDRPDKLFLGKRLERETKKRQRARGEDRKREGPCYRDILPVETKCACMSGTERRRKNTERVMTEVERECGVC